MLRIFLSVVIFLILAGTAVSNNAYRIITDIPEDGAYADSVLQVTQKRLNLLIGSFRVAPLDIYIVTSEDRFDSLAGPSVPDWGAGVAIPHRNLIVIKSPLILRGEKSLGELVAHEFSHIALARRLKRHQGPRWLNEGMAMYLSAEWGWSDNLSVSWAVVLGAIIPLREIENLNRFEKDIAQVAYSESYLAFKYFIDTYGKSSLNILLDRIAAGASPDRAFIAAIGMRYAGFEREFSAYLHGRYNMLTLIFDSNLLWIMMALVVVVGFILSRLRRKKRLEEFDEYEKYHSTDFDYGEVEKPDEDDRWD